MLGALAVLQYAGLWVALLVSYDLGNPEYAIGVGEHSVIDQITRLILMSSMVVLSLAIVVRAQRLLQMAAHATVSGYGEPLKHATQRWCLDYGSRGKAYIIRDRRQLPHENRSTMRFASERMRQATNRQEHEKVKQATSGRNSSPSKRKSPQKQ